MESGKNIGEVFKEKLYDYSENPSDQVWENIQNNPDLIKYNKSAKFNAFRYFVGGAAIVAITTLAIVGYNYFSNSEMPFSLKENKEIAIEPIKKTIEPNQNIVTQIVENNPQQNKVEAPIVKDNPKVTENKLETNNVQNQTSENLFKQTELKQNSKNETSTVSKNETTVSNPVNSTISTSKVETNNNRSTSQPNLIRTIKNVIPIKATKDTIICRWTGLNLTIEGATSVVWSSGSTSSQIYVEPTESSVYNARVTNSEGNDTNIRIFIQVVDCYQIYMPTAFTPDGDGLNDEFKVVYNGDISDFEMMIFTRSGKKVFESRNINFGWDGKISGSQIEEGAYFYVVRYKDANDKIREQTGQVILYRSR